MRYLLIALTALLTVGCAKDIQYNAQYPDDELVVNGEINLQTGVRVKLTRSLPPVGTYEFSKTKLKILDANIALYENDSLVGNLLFNPADSLYYSTATFAPALDKRYRLHVAAPGYTDVTSTAIRIPADFAIDSTQFGSLDYQNLLSFYLQSATLPAYIGFEVRAFYQSEQLSVGHTFQNISNEQVQCSSVIYSNAYSFLEAACLADRSTVRLLCEATGYSPDGTNTYPVEQYKVTVKHISEEFFKYVQSVPTLEGFETAFTEPKLTYSNLSNGYGIWVASNARTIVF